MNDSNRYRSPATSGIAVSASLAAGILLDLWAALYALTHWTSGLILPFDAYGQLHVVVRLATLVLFLAWLERAYGNLRSFGHIPDYDGGLATLSIFIPPFCFYRPAQLVDEIWRASRPQGEEDRPGLLVYVWWVAFWIPPLVIGTSMLKGGVSALTAVEKTMRATTNGVFNCIAGFLGVLVVYAINERQAAKTDELRRLRAAEAAALVRERKAALIKAAMTPPSPVPSPFSVESTEVPPPVRPQTAVAPAPIPPQAPYVARPPVIVPVPVVRRTVDVPIKSKTLDQPVEPNLSRGWMLVLIGTMYLSGICLIGVAAATGFDEAAPRRIVAAACLVFGLLIIGSAKLVRYSPGKLWSGAALASVVVAILNLLWLVKVIGL
jgi:hypothetical protein